mgnify:CR=1 FL=1|nr:MAG TPA: hypothetical protein [Bacteriophage sp.]
MNKKLERNIKIKDEYFQLIVDCGFDYDGLNSIESLKYLVDDLVDLAKSGLKSDDKRPIYFAHDKQYNILNEELDNGICK